MAKRQRGARRAAEDFVAQVAAYDMQESEDDESAGSGEEEGEEDALFVQPHRSKAATKRPRKGAPKRKRSAIHYMFQICKNDATRVKCLFDSADPKHMNKLKRSSNKTTSLLDHARSFHGPALRAIEKAISENEDPTSVVADLLDNARVPARVGAMDRFVRRQVRTPAAVSGLAKTMSLVVWQIAKNIPFSAVDCLHWATFLQQHGAIMESRQPRMDLLSVLYEYCMGQIREQFSCCAAMSLAADTWQTNLNMGGHNYLTITGTAVTRDWVFVSHVISLVPVLGPHFSETLAACVSARMDSLWSGVPVENQPLIATCSSDSAANMRRGCTLYCGEQDAMPCVNHRLKLVVDDVFGNGTDVGTCVAASRDFVVIKTVVSFIRCTASNRREFLAAQEELDIEDPVGLCFWNATRWEGMHDAVVRVLRVRNELTALSEGGCFSVCIGDLEKAGVDVKLDLHFFERLQLYSPLLHNLHVASKALQSACSPTAAVVPSVVHGLLEQLTISPVDSSLIADLKKQLTASLNDRLGFVLNTVNNFIKAALVHPKYSSMPFVPAEILDDNWIAFIEDAKLVIPKTVPEPLLPALASALRAHFNGASLQKCDDPLAYWRLPEMQVYNALFPAVQMMLGIPAGSSGPERVFSGTTETITRKRNRLGASAVEMTTVVRNFVHKPCYSFKHLLEHVSRVAANECTH